MQILPLVQSLGGVVVGSQSLPKFVAVAQTEWLPEDVVTALQTGNMVPVAFSQKPPASAAVPSHEM